MLIKVKKATIMCVYVCSALEYIYGKYKHDL